MEDIKIQISLYFKNVNLNEKNQKNFEEIILNRSLKNNSDLVYSESKDKGIYFLLMKKKCLKILESTSSNKSKIILIAATILFTLLVENLYKKFFDFHDILAEVSSLPGPLSLPADFNLDGDFSQLNAFIADSLPKDSLFSPGIPKQIASFYTGYEGRFFTFQGRQGVSINLQPTSFATLSGSLALTSQDDTLYILKLSNSDDKTFPVKKVSKKIKFASGKVKKVYAWREGLYGYAMVQTGVNDFNLMTP